MPKKLETKKRSASLPGQQSQPTNQPEAAKNTSISTETVKNAFAKGGIVSAGAVIFETRRGGGEPRAWYGGACANLGYICRSWAADGGSRTLGRTVRASNMGDLQRDRLGQRPLHTTASDGQDDTCPSLVRGIDRLRDPHLNKVGLGLFSIGGPANQPASCDRSPVVPPADLDAAIQCCACTWSPDRGMR